MQAAKELATINNTIDAKRLQNLIYEWVYRIDSPFRKHLIEQHPNTLQENDFTLHYNGAKLQTAAMQITKQWMLLKKDIIYGNSRLNSSVISKNQIHKAFNTCRITLIDAFTTFVKIKNSMLRITNKVYVTNELRAQALNNIKQIAIQVIQLCAEYNCLRVNVETWFIEAFLPYCISKLLRYDFSPSETWATHFKDALNKKNVSDKTTESWQSYFRSFQLSGFKNQFQLNKLQTLPEQLTPLKDYTVEKFNDFWATLNQQNLKIAKTNELQEKILRWRGAAPPAAAGGADRWLVLQRALVESPA